MEFFKIININSTEHKLKEIFSIENMDSWISNLFPIGELEGDRIQIGGLWGEFTLQRTEIKGGVRFALLECPNALAWTITTGYPPNPNGIVIHCTINRREKPDEFLEEVDEFMGDIETCTMESFQDSLMNRSV